METAGCCFFDLFFTLIKPEYCPDMSENEVLGLSIVEWESYAEDKVLYLERAGGLVTEESKIIEDITRLLQRQIVKDFFIKFTKNPQKRCQKHRMAPDTSFDRLHFSVQQVFAEIRIVWQLVDIWLPAPLDFGQFQRIGCLQCMIVARHIQNIHSNIIQTPAAEIGG